MRKRLYIFDLDGTLVHGHVEKRGEGFVETLPFHIVAPLPGRVPEVRRLKGGGAKVAVCTNKAGVAFGHSTVEECLAKADLTREVFGLSGWPQAHYRGDTWHECYTHPHAKLEQFRGEDRRRKPGPGMLEEALLVHGVRAQEALYVGDMDVDEAAAEAAGIDFMWAEDFFIS